MSDESIEQRIKSIKKRREKLLNKKAQKEAVLEAAKEDFQDLKSEVEDEGYDLKNLPDILKEKKKELNAKLALAEDALEEAEEKFDKYED